MEVEWRWATRPRVSTFTTEFGGTRLLQCSRQADASSPNQDRCAVTVRRIDREHPRNGMPTPAVTRYGQLALARATDVLRPVGVVDPLWSPKWDGWRALWGAGRLWGRRGTDLTRYFPDLVNLPPNRGGMRYEE